MSTTARHFAFLDGIRGWAAFAVLLFHLQIERPETNLVLGRTPQWLLEALGTGKLGVAVFFVLSGLVIAYSLRASLETTRPDTSDQKITASGDRPRFNVGNFVLRRIVRLTPPYHAAIIVALVFALGAALEGGHDYLPGGTPFGMARLFAHLVYVQELFGFVNFNDVFWTLSIELQFYLAFAGLVFAQDRLGRIRPPATTLRILYGISAAISLLWPFGLLGDDARPVWFAPLWYSFMLGVLLFARWRRQIPAWSLVLYMALLSMGPLVTDRDGQFAWVSVATTALLWIAVERDRLGRWLADRPSQFLGRVSYSLYLIHTPILGAGLVVGAKLLGEPTVAKQLLTIVVSVTVTLVAAEVFHRAIERPAIVMSRRLRSGQPHPPGRPRNRRITIMP
ncbi:MAG: acyltransferase [Acidimicrobiia bacterium]|nr:acyltransferase [Acidimicrobiia bacterium]